MNFTQYKSAISKPVVEATAAHLGMALTDFLGLPAPTAERHMREFVAVFQACNNLPDTLCPVECGGITYRYTSPDAMTYGQWADVQTLITGKAEPEQIAAALLQPYDPQARETLAAYLLTRPAVEVLGALSVFTAMPLPWLNSSRVS